MKVAIIGIGRMGAGMAVRLRESGADVVVWNRTPAKAEATGCAVAGTAREAVAAADVVLVSLADDAAVVAAYDGPDGVVAGLREGTVVVESSTVDPQTVRRVEPLVTGRGATLLDGPVSGSIALVEKGQLTFMVGGPAEGIDRVRPVLDPLARQVFHVGPLGSGAVVKLAVNTVVLALNQALAESLVLAERAGVARETMYEVLANSAVGSPFVSYKRAAFERPGQVPVAFSIDLVAKDLDLVRQLAERVGARMPQAGTNLGVATAAVAAALGDRDMSAVATYLRMLSGEL
ncbi:NAD(P)-dependent oxidoreductase [Phytohabitans suffuscus]|uniref:Tartronate semialdehyde reductase n=1 Tax=Phytohabitans suffuscus TaxID=624315 RepID=A0A6F8YFW2_9ACTN|nr:NAD(P)-dependent oxidoreductase [Phytohabitans suffuscus]BCB84957.1 tartronate semialdehyde reductase [Phytohabitans suffuscus]